MNESPSNQFRLSSLSSKDEMLRDGILGKHGHFLGRIATYFKSAPKVGPYFVKTSDMAFLGVGNAMENQAAELKAINDEVSESKRILESLANDVSSLSNIVEPQLLKAIRDIRASRMTIVSEIQSALSALRDVRKFFLDSDYAKETERLERFVNLCKELQALKASGTLDAVSDTILRLSMKDTTNER